MGNTNQGFNKAVGNELEKINSGNNQFSMNEKQYERTWWIPENSLIGCYLTYSKIRFPNLITEAFVVFDEKREMHIPMMLIKKVYTLELGSEEEQQEEEQETELNFISEQETYNLELFVEKDFGKIIRKTLDKYDLIDPEKKKYILCPIDLAINTIFEDIRKNTTDTLSHANLLIFNRNTGIMELFEPYGVIHNTNEKINLIIQEWCSMNLGERYKGFKSSEQICAGSKGLQQLFEYEGRKGTAGQHCVGFSFIFLHLKLLFPEITSEDIIKIANEKNNLETIRLMVFEYLKFLSLFCQSKGKENFNQENIINEFNKSNIQSNKNKIQREMMETLLCYDLGCLKIANIDINLKQLDFKTLKIKEQEIYYFQSDVSEFKLDYESFESIDVSKNIFGSCQSFFQENPYKMVDIEEYIDFFIVSTKIITNKKYPGFPQNTFYMKCIDMFIILVSNDNMFPFDINENGDEEIYPSPPFYAISLYKALLDQDTKAIIPFPVDDKLLKKLNDNLEEYYKKIPIKMIDKLALEITRISLNTNDYFEILQNCYDQNKVIIKKNNITISLKEFININQFRVNEIVGDLLEKLRKEWTIVTPFVRWNYIIEETLKSLNNDEYEIKFSRNQKGNIQALRILLNEKKSINQEE